jgi:hypothetical protein
MGEDRGEGGPLVTTFDDLLDGDSSFFGFEIVPNVSYRISPFATLSHSSHDLIQLLCLQVRELNLHVEKRRVIQTGISVV